MEVMVCRDWIYMSQISRQIRQFGIEIRARSVPSFQNPNSCAVTQVMQTWRTAAFIDYSRRQT